MKSKIKEMIDGLVFVLSGEFSDELKNIAEISENPLMLNRQIESDNVVEKKSKDNYWLPGSLDEGIYAYFP